MDLLLFIGALTAIVLIEGVAIYQLIRMNSNLEDRILAMDKDLTELNSLKERVSTTENWIELAVPWMKNTQHRISLLKTKVQKMREGAIVLKDEEDTTEDKDSALDAKGEFTEALFAAETVAEGLKNEE